LTSNKEQFYIQRISELEAQLKQRDERIAVFTHVVFIDFVKRTSDKKTYYKAA